MVEAELTRLIERRADDAKRTGKDGAAEEAWRASERREAARRRRENDAAWYEFYSRLADSHARISEEFERRAVALLEDPEGGR